METQEQPALTHEGDSSLPPGEKKATPVAVVDGLTAPVPDLSLKDIDPDKVESEIKGISEGKKGREQIVWNGTKGTDSYGNSGDKDEEPSPKRLRPNPAFLKPYLNGVNKTNKRLIAEAASNAACKELTAVAASGAKVQFDRISERENDKFRRTALSVAKQQNQACCIALLKEVAAHYGFALDLDTGNHSIGGSGEGESIALQDDLSEEEEAEPDPRVMQPLYARLRSDLEDLDSSLDHRKRPQPEPGPDRPIQIPVIATNNRLAHSALAAITGIRGPRGLVKPPGRPAENAPHSNENGRSVKSFGQLAMDAMDPAGPSQKAVPEGDLREAEDAQDLSITSARALRNSQSPDAISKDSTPRAVSPDSQSEAHIAPTSSKAVPLQSAQAMAHVSSPGNVKLKTRGAFKSRIFSSFEPEETDEGDRAESSLASDRDIAEERYRLAEENVSAEKLDHPVKDAPVIKTPKPSRKSGNRLFGAAMSSLGR